MGSRTGLPILNWGSSFLVGGLRHKELLAPGWKGDYIFPIMFAGVALGMAVNLVFPGISVAVTVAATMAGALVTTLKAPLYAALFTTVLVQKETAAVIAVAVVVSALLAAVLALRAARRAAASPADDVVRVVVDIHGRLGPCARWDACERRPRGAPMSSRLRLKPQSGTDETR
jgi:hypothetical protein